SKRRLAVASWIGLLAVLGFRGSNPSAFTHSISGAVSGAIADGVVIALGGTMIETTTTAADGLDSFSGLAAGPDSLTPSNAGYTFSPARIVETLNGGNATGLNFTALAPCSADDWRWRNPLPQGSPRSRVWGSGASDVWAVGDVGTIVHWNGSVWT